MNSRTYFISALPFCIAQSSNEPSHPIKNKAYLSSCKWSKGCNIFAPNRPKWPCTLKNRGVQLVVSKRLVAIFQVNRN